MTKPENGYEFKVNGEQFAAEKPELTALEILTIAKQGGATKTWLTRINSIKWGSDVVVPQVS